MIIAPVNLTLTSNANGVGAVYTVAWSAKSSLQTAAVLMGNAHAFLTNG